MRQIVYDCLMAVPPLPVPAALSYPDPRLVPVALRRVGAAEQARVVEAVAVGKSLTAAAKGAGVSYAVVKRALELDPGFRERVEAAREEKWSVVEDRWYKAVLDGEPWAVREGLRRAPGVRDSFREPETVSVSVSEIGPGLAGVLELRERLAERRSALEVSGSELPGAGT